MDRLHIKGHKQKWCQKMCHPDNSKELYGTNTVVCEQINYWLGRYKHIMKHMNIYRFHFYLHILLIQKYPKYRSIFGSVPRKLRYFMLGVSSVVYRNWTEKPSFFRYNCMLMNEFNTLQVNGRFNTSASFESRIVGLLLTFL